MRERLWGHNRKNRRRFVLQFVTRTNHSPTRGRDFSSEDSNPDSESGFQIRKTRPCALGTLFTRKATPLHTLGVS